MELGIDVESLAKGDVVSDATIRQSVATVFGEVEDPIEFLKLRNQLVERWKAILKKRGISAGFHGDDLLIHTDAESSAYNSKWFENYRRRLRVRNHLLREVDRSNLDREQQAKHDRAVLKQASILAAVSRAVRTMPRVVVQRQTPTGRPAPREQRRMV